MKGQLFSRMSKTKPSILWDRMTTAELFWAVTRVTAVSTLTPASKPYSLKEFSFHSHLHSSASGNFLEIFLFFAFIHDFCSLFHTLMMCMQRHVAVKSYSTNFSLCSDFLCFRKAFDSVKNVSEP